MKTVLLLSTVLFYSTYVAAESISCVDSKGTWEISFDLNDTTASNVVFLKHGKTQEKFSSQTANMTRLALPFASQGRMIYEFDFGFANYLDLDRPFRGDVLADTFKATFLLGSNPVAFEKHANCTVL